MGVVLGEARDEADRLAVDGRERRQLAGRAERASEQRVVAEFGVRVEGEVVCGEGDAGVEQELETVLEERVDRAHARVPDEAVVDDEQLGVLAGGELEQGRICRDARGDGVHAVRAGHLQTVDAVVLEACRVQQTVELGEDLGGGGGHCGEGSGRAARGLREAWLERESARSARVGEHRAPCLQRVWDTGGASGRGAAW